MASSENVEVGGSSIMYPLNNNMDLQYHVSVNEVKQEFVLDKLSNEVRETHCHNISAQMSPRQRILRSTRNNGFCRKMWNCGQMVNLQIIDDGDEFTQIGISN